MFRRFPIVVLSVRDGAQIRSECLAIGATEVFAKPVSDQRCFDRSVRMSRRLRHQVSGRRRIIEQSQTR